MIYMSVFFSSVPLISWLQQLCSEVSKSISALYCIHSFTDQFWKILCLCIVYEDDEFMVAKSLQKVFSLCLNVGLLLWWGSCLPVVQPLLCHVYLLYLLHKSAQVAHRLHWLFSPWHILRCLLRCVVYHHSFLIQHLQMSGYSVLNFTPLSFKTLHISTYSFHNLNTWVE